MLKLRIDQCLQDLHNAYEREQITFQQLHKISCHLVRARELLYKKESGAHLVDLDDADDQHA